MGEYIEEVEGYVMPLFASMMSVPPGENNYALVVSFSNQPVEVHNTELLRDKLIACGWNVEYYAGKSATIGNVMNGLTNLRNVVGGARVLIYLNDHSIITTQGPPCDGTYTLEGGTLKYSDLDTELDVIAGNFAGEKVLFVTGPRSGSSARCDHSIWIDAAKGGIILTSTDEYNDFGGGPDPCDLAAAWTSCDMPFLTAWQSLPPGGYQNP